MSAGPRYGGRGRRYLHRQLALYGLLLIGFFVQLGLGVRSFEQRSREGLIQHQAESEAYHRSTMEKYDEAIKHAFPTYDNFPALSDEEFQPLSGQWEVVQFWDSGWCLASRERDKARGDAHRYAVEIGRNSLLYGEIVKLNPSGFPSPTPGESGMFSTVIWGSHGAGTFSMSYGSEKLENVVYTMNCYTSDRGIYMLDGPRLYIYWIDAWNTTKDMALPDYFPLKPRDEGTCMLVLERPRPEESPLTIAFKSRRTVQSLDNLPPTTDALELERRRMAATGQPFGPGHPIITPEGEEYVIEELPPDIKQIYEQMKKDASEP